MWKQCEEWRKWLGSYVKNNIKPLLIGVKTRIIICEERDDLKEFKTIEKPRKVNRLKKECIRIC